MRRTIVGFSVCPPKTARRQIAFWLTLSLASYARGDALEREALADLSLEDLAALPVISVTKTQKPVSEAAASIFVITEHDIHSAGSPTLPEALRLAPNLQVARVDTRNYAISARGFNGPFANKLLVMIDGRTIYSPLFPASIGTRRTWFLKIWTVLK